MSSSCHAPSSRRSSRRWNKNVRTFVEFPTKDVEFSTPTRFETIARTYGKQAKLALVDKRTRYPQAFQKMEKVQYCHLKLDKRIRCLIASLLIGAVVQLQDALAKAPYIVNAGGFDADAYVSWPVIVAKEKNFFAKEGIQLRLIRTDRAMMGLLAGGLEVINAGASAALSAGEKGASLSIVYVLCDRPAEFMLLRKPLSKLSDLNGRTIGVYQVPSTVQLFLKEHLQRNGLDLSTITFRALGGSRERFASLLAGQVSATLLSMTYANRAQQAGLAIVASPENWRKVPWNVVTFRRPWAAANPMVVVKYLRALLLATSWLYDPNNFDEAVRTLTPLSHLDENTVRWGLQFSIKSKIFNLTQPTAEAFQNFAEWLGTEKILPRSFDVTSLVDAHYYELAVKELK